MSATAWFASLCAVLTLAMSAGCDPTPGDDSTPPEGDTDSDTDTDTDTDTDSDPGSLGRVAVLERWDQLDEEASGVVSAWGPLDSAWEPGIVGDWIISCDEQSGDTGVWRVVETFGECELAVLERCGGDCEPGCEPGQYCTAGLTCVDAPEVVDAGELSVEGLAVDVTLSWSGWGYPSPWDLPAELFGPGDAVTLDAPGGDMAGFTAAATGVEALDATLPCDAVMPAGQDLNITWTPSGSADTRVRWDMTQDVHLSQGPRVRCETEDDGSLTIPAELVGRYLYGQKHGLTLTRYTQDRVDLGGGRFIDFELGSVATCTINADHTPW